MFKPPTIYWVIGRWFKQNFGRFSCRQRRPDTMCKSKDVAQALSVFWGTWLASGFSHDNDGPKNKATSSTGIQYTSIRNKDGSITVTLTVTAKLVNLSGNSTIDVNTLSTKINEKGYTFKGTYLWNRGPSKNKSKIETINLYVTLNIIPVQSAKEIGKDDYAIGIVPKISNCDNQVAGGCAELYGKYAAVGLIYVSNVGVYVHEIGHLLGLDDRKLISDGGGIMHSEKSFFIPPSDVWTIAQSFVVDNLGKSGYYTPAKPSGKNFNQFIEDVKN